MKPLVCSILISMMIVILGCNTPNQKPVSKTPPASANQEIETEQPLAKKYTLTQQDKRLINQAWATGRLHKENWDLFLEDLSNEPDPNTAVKNALDNSFKARLRRSRTKWRRQLLTPR